MLWYFGFPDTIKMDNGPANASEQTLQLLQQWGVSHNTGIPHPPTSQAMFNMGTEH